MIDSQTINDNTVTIRERDSMKQERVLIEILPDIIKTLTSIKDTYLRTK